MAPIGLNAQSTVIIPDYGGTGITEIGLAPPPGSIEAQEGQAFTDVFGEANALGGFWDFWENPTGASGAAAGPTGDTFSGNNWGQVYFAYGTDQAISYTLEYVPDPAALPGSSTAIFAPLSADSTLLPPTPLSQDVAAEIPYQYYPGSSTPSATYTVALGANTVGETLAISAPANPQPSTNGTTNGTSETESPSFVLGGTYTSTSDAVFQSSSIAPIAISGSGIFKTPLLSVAGFVNVTGGTLQGDQTYIDTAIPTSFPENYLPTGYTNVFTASSASLTLTGATAVFNASTFVVVGATPINAGNSATAPSTLLLQQGAQANVGFISVGENAMSSGIITVDGSTLNANNLVQIGESGTGAMTVQDKGIVNVTTTNGNVAVGSQMGGVGNLTITGTGSTMTVAGQMAVGAPNSTGNMLSILLGGTLICGNGTAATNFGVVAGQTGGAFSNSGGAVLIDGYGSLWDVKGSLSIGSGGAGSVYVNDGGALTVEGTSIDLGHYQGATGSLTFDGDPDADGTSPYFTFNGNQAQLIVGDQGTGNLFVQGGATITTTANVVIGNSGGDTTTGTGTATVMGRGSQLTVGGLTVGLNGIGTLNIQDGDLVSVTNGNVVLGENAGSNGTLSLTGPGSQLALSAEDVSQIIIGQNGTGNLILEGGATASLVDTELGASTSGHGTITVDGTAPGGGSPSTLTENLTLTVGEVSGMGASPGPGIPGVVNSLTITGGGVVTCDSSTIGNQTNSYGSVTIAGMGSQWDIGDSDRSSFGLIVGRLGTGVLNINNQANLTLSEVGVAANGIDGSGSGTINVNGASSGAAQTAFSVTQALDIGVTGNGTLNANGGAQVVTVTLTAIGQDDMSSGTVTLTDPNTRWSAGQIRVGGSGGASDGVGTINVQNGALLTTNSSALTLNFGTVTVTGHNSTLTAPVTFGANGNGASVFVQQGGQVKGSLTLNGNVSTVTVDGQDPMTQAPSSWDVAMLTFAAGQGQINVQNDGNMTVDSGPIDFSPAAFQLDINTSGTVNATSSAITIAGNSGIQIQSGGVLNSSGATIDNSQNMNASAILDGTNSTWNIQGGLTVANGASLHVGAGANDGASLTVASDTTVTSNSMVFINGGQMTTAGVDFDSGSTVQISNGGTFTNNGSSLGATGVEIYDSAAVTVTGSGSTINTPGGISMGTGGTLTVSNSGHVSAGNTVSLSSGAVIDVSGGGSVTVGATLLPTPNGTVEVG
ncbi:MAG: hypothetical protein ABSH22_18760, partial [Tepidisphaeraceae bacterium]